MSLYMLFSVGTQRGIIIPTTVDRWDGMAKRIRHGERLLQFCAAVIADVLYGNLVWRLYTVVS